MNDPFELGMDELPVVSEDLRTGQVVYSVDEPVQSVDPQTGQAANEPALSVDAHGQVVVAQFGDDSALSVYAHEQVVHSGDDFVDASELAFLETGHFVFVVG